MLRLLWILFLFVSYPPLSIKTQDAIDPQKVKCVNGKIVDNVCKCNPWYSGESCEERSCENEIDFCNNHGVCSVENGELKCYCHSFWGGDRCDVPLKREILCPNEMDKSDPINLKCKCSENYYGRFCELYNCKNDSECNDGVCIKGKKNFCNCQHGYIGGLCDRMSCKFYDRCPPPRECVIIRDKFACVCPKGYTGENCNKPICDSKNNPCYGGTCFRSRHKVTCQCKPGYRGEFCDKYYCTNVEYCGNGVCIAANNSYYCKCNDNYAGSHCVLEKCDSVKYCGNKGECLKSNGALSCKCENGFKGMGCATAYCDFGSCKNDGKCYVENNKKICLCLLGYSGEKCEIESCIANNNCLNMGKCLKNGSDYACFCPNGWTGKKCEIPTCDGYNPCINGECVTSKGKHSCKCLEGYRGDLCEYSLCTKQSICKNGICFTNGNLTICDCSIGWVKEKCSENCSVQKQCNENECKFDQTCSCPKNANGRYCQNIDCQKAENACLNDGICTVSGDSTFCKCRSFRYYGVQCENRCDRKCATGYCKVIFGNLICICQDTFDKRKLGVVQGCSDDQCSNNGKCKKIGEESRCICNRKYTGKHCNFLCSRNVLESDCHDLESCNLPEPTSIIHKSTEEKKVPKKSLFIPFIISTITIGVALTIGGAIAIYFISNMKEYHSEFR